MLVCIVLEVKIKETKLDYLQHYKQIVELIDLLYMFIDYLIKKVNKQISIDLVSKIKKKINLDVYILN